MATIHSLPQNLGWWSTAEEEEYHQHCRKSVLDAMTKAEQQKKPNPLLLFSDVYDRMPSHIREQMTQQVEHMGKYKAHYATEDFRPVVDPEQ